MTSEQFINKYGETFFKAEKLGSFYNDVHKLISCHVEKVESLESQNKDLIKALEAIRKLTSDEQSPLMKALHEIAHKTLKAVNKK